MEGATIAKLISHGPLGFTPTGLCFPASEPHAALLPLQPPGWGSLPLTRASPWVITSVGNPTNTHFNSASAQLRILCIVCMAFLFPACTVKGNASLKMKILTQILCTHLHAVFDPYSVPWSAEGEFLKSLHAAVLHTMFILWGCVKLYFQNYIGCGLPKWVVKWFLRG